MAVVGTASIRVVLVVLVTSSAMRGNPSAMTSSGDTRSEISNLPLDSVFRPRVVRQAVQSVMTSSGNPLSRVVVRNPLVMTSSGDTRSMKTDVPLHSLSRPRVVRQAMTSSGNFPPRAGNPSAMTSPENSASRSAVTVQWAVDEERPAGSVIGDLRQSLTQFVDADRLAGTSFQTLARPNQDLEALDVDRTTGLVTATDTRLDREAVCPAMSHNQSVECTIDINVGLVRSLQLEQVNDIYILYTLMGGAPLGAGGHEPPTFRGKRDRGT